MENKRITIIGGGSSVRQNQWDNPVASLPLWNLLKDEATISINYVFRYLEPTIACFHDETFYRSNLNELSKVPLIIGAYARNVEAVLMPNTYLVKIRSDWAPNQWETAFYGSNLCGVLALSLAINLGYTEIYLLGYDFCSDKDGRTHFYQDEVDLSERDCNHQPKYRGIGFRDDGNGNKIYKCTNYQNNPDKYFKPFENYKDISITLVGESKINTFPKMDYNNYFEQLKKYPQAINQSYTRDEIETNILTKIKK